MKVILTNYFLVFKNSLIICRNKLISKKHFLSNIGLYFKIAEVIVELLLSSKKINF